MIAALDRPPARPALSAREVVLLQCLAHARTNRQTARVLNMMPQAVASHVARLRRRTGAVSRLQLVVWAIQWGVLTP